MISGSNNFTPQELQFSNDAVKTYKRISDVIWFGDLYRLISPYEENRAVLIYVNENKDQGHSLQLSYQHPEKGYFFPGDAAGT